MGIIPYTAMTYGLTAVISLLVVAIIVGISKLTSRPGQTDDGEGGAVTWSSLCSCFPASEPSLRWNP